MKQEKIIKIAIMLICVAMIAMLLVSVVSVVSDAISSTVHVYNVVAERTNTINSLLASEDLSILASGSGK